MDEEKSSTQPSLYILKLPNAHISTKKWLELMKSRVDNCPFSFARHTCPRPRYLSSWTNKQTPGAVVRTTASVTHWAGKAAETLTTSPRSAAEGFGATGPELPYIQSVALSQTTHLLILRPEQRCVTGLTCCTDVARVGNASSVSNTSVIPRTDRGSFT